MTEQMLQSILEDLGSTISQLTINLAAERATVKELSKQLEESEKKLVEALESKEIKTSEEE